jgi:chromosome partitioning protein
VSVSPPEQLDGSVWLDSAVQHPTGRHGAVPDSSGTAAGSQWAVSRETVSQDGDGALNRSRPRHARTRASQPTTQSGARQVSCPPSAPPGVSAEPAAGAPAGSLRAAVRVSPADTSVSPADTGWTPIAEEAERATRVKHPARRLPRPARRRVLAVANQKGGVGKTTSTVNLAAGLALQGLRTLVIDLDPQGNASTALGIEHRAGTRSVYEVLLGEIGIADAIAVSPQSSNLLCVPATIDLAGSEIELVSMVARESRLYRALDGAVLDKLGVDYVFIDCPPSLGLLTVNALVAAPEVLIPIQCEYYALEGLGQLLRNIELVQAHLNPALTVSTILLTMYDGRTKLADQVTAEVRSHFGDQVLRTVIPRSVKISEAPGFGQTVLVYDPGSRGALSYVDAAREIALNDRYLDRGNSDQGYPGDGQPGAREVSR